MTPVQYAKQEIAEGRFPSMPVYEVAGSFYLCDADWHVLAGSKAYTSRMAAESDRSKIVDRAGKAHWREAASLSR